MNSIRSSMILPLFGLLASMAACTGQTTDETASTNNAVTPVATTTNVEKPGREHGPRMGHGPESLIFAALHESIDLTDAQRTTIRASLETLKPKGPPPAGNKTALVAAVRAGKIDTTVLAMKPVEIDREARTAAVAKALTTLHATLSKEQRVALVAAMQKGVEGHKQGGPKHEGKPGEGKGFGHPFGPMRMFEDLDLTKDQQDAIHAKLAANKPAPMTDAQREAMKTQFEAMRKEMDARLQTFTADTFDATAFLAPIANAPKMDHGPHGDRMIEDLAAIVPLLTPAQREKLAAKLEKGPHAHPAAQ